MTSIRIRPRFKHHVELSSKEIQEKIHQSLKNEDAVCRAVQVPGYTVLKIPAKSRHFWSPQLSLSLEEEDGKTFISGLYGPNPTVWAVFFFGYGAIGVLSLFATIYGLVEVILSKDWTFMLSLPILAIIALILYFIAQFGQKLGVEQTFEIHHFYESIVNSKVSIS